MCLAPKKAHSKLKIRCPLGAEERYAGAFFAGLATVNRHLCDLHRRSSKKAEQHPFIGYTAQAATLIREVYARNKAVYKKHVKRTHCPTRHRIIGGILVFPRFPILQSEYLRWLSENLHDIFHFLSRQH